MILGRRSAPLALAALCLLVSAGGCGTAPTTKPKTVTSSTLCKPDAIAECERSIASASLEGRDVAAMVDAYADALASSEPSSPWSKLFADSKAASGKVVFVLEAGAEARSDLGKTLRADALPPRAGIDTDVLLATLGEARGWETIVRVQKDPASTKLVFPRDPLRPFMAGLPPVVLGDLSRIEDDLALADAVRRAAEHAGGFRYIEAAREAERLSGLIAARKLAKGQTPGDEPAIRASYMLTLLEAAGIALEPANEPAESVRQDEPPPVTVLPGATPYADLLRVRATKDAVAAWKVLGERIVAAVPEGKRAALRALYRPEGSCEESPLPSIDGPDDLAFASTVPRALSPTLAGTQTRGTLPLAEWLPRYEALVRAIEEGGTTWAHAFFLTQQRGEIGGISLATTPTYRRVTTLASAHLAALAQLEQAHPDRMRAMSVVTLAYAPGLVADAPLRSALLDLLKNSVKDRLDRAKDASGVFDAALTGALAATAYPPAIQSAFISALVGAFQDKLKTDLSKQEGWGVAGLFAVDAAVRFLTGEAPDLEGSAAEISRALSSASIERRPLARLAASAARYVALATEKKLDPELSDPARFPAERRAARDALREAVASFGEGSDPLPQGLLDDVTTLGDQTITAIATVLLDKPKGTDKVCANKGDGPSPAARRVLARIGDVRRKILASPSYKSGEGASIRSLRLVVTILSDAIDIAGRPAKDKRVTFTVNRADAERVVTEALAAWGDRAFADAFTVLYGIARGYLDQASANANTSQSVDVARAKKLVSALAVILRDERTGAAPAILEALERAGKIDSAAATGPGIEGLLVAYANALRTADRPAQADLCILGAMLLSVAADKLPPDAAIDAANKDSELGWVLRFAREVFRARKGIAPNPAEYTAGMHEVVKQACEDPAIADDMVAVMSAVRLANSGDRKSARAELERFLDKAEAQGLLVPRMSYKYEEKTVSKVFTLSLDLSLGAGLLEGSSSFALGLGVRTPALPEATFTARLAPVRGTERDAEAARYYIHAATIAAAYHFLDGDTSAGAKDAARAIDAAVFGARLGGVPLGAPDVKTLAADAKGMLAITAVLAADAGMPLLAGDLWTLVRATLADDTDDKTLAEILTTPPVAIAGLESTKPLIERAKRALRVVGEPLACTDEKVELGAFEAPDCETYPLALSLRAGGALRKLPRIRRGDAGRACSGPMPSLDAFLGGMEQKNYDPDAFTRATLELSAAGRTYDAAVLLARQRQPTHCNPSLVTASRSIGRSPLVGASLRSDALSVAVNCSNLDDQAVADIALLDAETASLADRNRNLALVMFAAELGLTRNRWDVLARLAKSPTFVSRWLDTTPEAALLATNLAIAASILAKDPTLAEPAVRPYELFCVTLPTSNRELCNAAASMRKTGADDLDASARAAVQLVLQRVSRGKGSR